MLTETEEIEYLELLEQDERDSAKVHHIDFMRYCWMKKEPFVEGFHTQKICARIDKAMEDFRQGKSTYLIINVHHRAGKTDILSRYLPPHFLGEFPNCEIINTTFKAALTEKFTADARNIFRSDKYQELYPEIELSQESNAKAYWEIVDRKTGKPTYGKLFGSGLSSGITGSGAHLALCDDPLSGRAAAESSTIRDGVWEAITNDLFTRLAPVHIVIILATWWHWDDPSGRIRRWMKEVPGFPQFEVLEFPAKASDYKGEGKYPGKYLFTERYPEIWYNTQRALLGKYAAAALMDCNPMARTGGRFDVSGIDYVDTMPGAQELKWARIWDLAHTAKQREGDDPDWTSGTKMAFEYRDGDPIPYLYVSDVCRTREGASKRDDIIKSRAMSDGYYVKQAIENTIDSKDAYEYISKALPGISWTKLTIKGDKAARATPLEKIFEAPGHVIVKRGDWNDEWITEVLRFDGTGKDHDDQVDNLSAGYSFLVGDKTTFDTDFITRMEKARNQ
jgi:predicted phage terminase large subunit-like protein